jgi:hypothetical protein
MAVKFTRGVRGRRCNRYEAELYRRVRPDQRNTLCPPIWCSRGGNVLIARAAKPLTEQEYEDLMDGDRFPDWDYMPSDGVSQPFEYKRSDWGWLDGRLVAVDYSAPKLFDD